MSLFGLAFLLYFFNLLAGKSFWNNLRIADGKLYLQTINVERLLLKLKRYDCDLTFLMKCIDVGVYSKFVSYKNLKNQRHKVKNCYYRRILLHEITTMNRSIATSKNNFMRLKMFYMKIPSG